MATNGRTTLAGRETEADAQWYCKLDAARGSSEALQDCFERDIVRRLMVNDSTLDRVNLCARGMTDAESVVVSRSLESNNALTELVLSHNKLTSQALQVLAGALDGNTTLARLYVDHNAVDCAGVEALAAAMYESASLSRLYLHANRIRDRGAWKLASLCELPVLTHLKLDDNCIGPTGARALARALQHSTSALIELSLAGNPLRDKGAQALGVMLKSNRRLVKLNLARSKIGKAGCETLRQGLAYNNTLRVLFLDGNRMEESERQATQAVAQSLPTAACEADMAMLAVDPEPILSDTDSDGGAGDGGGNEAAADIDSDDEGGQKNELVLHTLAPPSLEIQLKLHGHVDALPPGSEARFKLQEGVCADLSEMLGVGQHRIVVKQLERGHEGGLLTTIDIIDIKDEQRHAGNDEPSAQALFDGLLDRHNAGTLARGTMLHLLDPSWEPCLKCDADEAREMTERLRHDAFIEHQRERADAEKELERLRSAAASGPGAQAEPADDADALLMQETRILLAADRVTEELGDGSRPPSALGGRPTSASARELEEMAAGRILQRPGIESKVEAAAERLVRGQSPTGGFAWQPVQVGSLGSPSSTSEVLPSASEKEGSPVAMPEGVPDPSMQEQWLHQRAAALETQEQWHAARETYIQDALRKALHKQQQQWLETNPGLAAAGRKRRGEDEDTLSALAPLQQLSSDAEQTATDEETASLDNSTLGDSSFTGASGTVYKSGAKKKEKQKSEPKDNSKDRAAKRQHKTVRRRWWQRRLARDAGAYAQLGDAMQFSKRAELQQSLIVRVREEALREFCRVHRFPAPLPVEEKQRLGIVDADTVAAAQKARRARRRIRAARTGDGRSSGALGGRKNGKEAETALQDEYKDETDKFVYAEDEHGNMMLTRVRDA